MTDEGLSAGSLSEATRGRAAFSGHGNSKGASGYVDPSDSSGQYDFLGKPGEFMSFNPPKEGFEEFQVGAAWDNIRVRDKGVFGKLFKKTKALNVDVDLGCLYELHNGERGVVQAFGELFGKWDEAPYMCLSGDERTGDTVGDDEFIRINGQKWPEIKRILVYVYIYQGIADWAQLKPQIQVRVPGQKPLVVVPSVGREELDLCVIATLENIRGGIKLTNHTEYYPGHAEMDRAFGFGLEWDDGHKR